MYKIRTSTKAIIVDDNKVLLIKYQTEYNTWYELPGGGQNFEETLKDCLKRECKEETGYDVTVGNLRYVRDYIEDNHELFGEHTGFHQLELYFMAKLENKKQGISHAQDIDQVDTCWIPIEDIPNIHFYPKKLKSLFANITDLDEQIYLGDIN